MRPRLVLEDLAIAGPAGMIVAGVSLTARAGRITVITGPSGAGKSVLGRALLGVIDVRPGWVAGRLRFPGVVEGDVLAGGPARTETLTRPLRGRYLALAPQAAATALNPARSVGGQLRRSLRRAGREADPGALLEGVGLRREVLRLRPHALSGGMAQRVALAVALAADPAVLVADEPETGLDVLSRREVTDRLVEEVAERNRALVLITHDERLAALGDEVVTLGG